MTGATSAAARACSDSDAFIEPRSPDCARPILPDVKHPIIRDEGDTERAQEKICYLNVEVVPASVRQCVGHPARFGEQSIPAAFFVGRFRYAEQPRKILESVGTPGSPSWRAAIVERHVVSYGDE